MKNGRLQKLINLLINQIHFSFKMRKNASFTETNMILITRLSLSTDFSCDVFFFRLFNPFDYKDNA